MKRIVRILTRTVIVTQTGEVLSHTKPNFWDKDVSKVESYSRTISETVTEQWREMTETERALFEGDND